MGSMITIGRKPDIEYLNNLELIPAKDFNFFLASPFIVRIDKNIVSVPAGFVTDLASVPRIFWFIYSPNDTRTISPAVVHDYMYSTPNPYSRREADIIFYYGLKKLGFGWRALKYYYAVRLFGWMFYKNKGRE